MNFIAPYPFYDAVIPDPVCKNTVSDVFLT